MKRNAHNRVRILTGTATAVSVVAVLAIVTFLFVSAAPLFLEGNPAATFDTAWRPFADPARYGIAPMIVASLVLSVFSVLLCRSVS